MRFIGAPFPLVVPLRRASVARQPGRTKTVDGQTWRSRRNGGFGTTDAWPARMCCPTGEGSVFAWQRLALCECNDAYKQHNKRFRMDIIRTPKQQTESFKMKKVILAVLVALSAASAMAQNAYVGASVGRAEQKAEVGPYGFKDKSNAFKVFGGYQFTQNIGLEAGYVKFNEAEVSGNGASLSAEPKTFYTAVTGTLPINEQLSAFAKVGAANTRTTVTGTINGVSYSDKTTETSAMFGLGLSYAFTPTVSVIAQYENFGKVIKDDSGSLKADLLSIGVSVKF
jgi:OOP family OmpA-OmpF porin